MYFADSRQWGPVVVVIEDLHWADASTRALFSLLARSTRPNSLLLVGTYRSDEVSTGDPMGPILADVERCARPEHLDLERLDRRSTAELVTALGGGTMTSESVDEIFHSSGGNPFFIEELVAARLTGMDKLPLSLRNVLLARTATLPAMAKTLLAIVALAGRTSPSVLAMVAKVDNSEITDALAELLARGLLVSDAGEIQFRHELARNVFAEELSAEIRANTHAALARSLVGAARTLG